MKTRSGHLFKRGKVWHVQWRVNGKLFMRSTKCTRKDKAEQERARIMAPFLAEDEATVLEHVVARIGGRKAEIAAYEESQNPPLTIDMAWVAYLKSPNRRDSGERTLADYGGYFKRFKKWVKSEHPEAVTLREVTEDMATEYARDLNGGTMSAGSFNKHRDFIKGMFQTLRKEAKLTENPWDDIKRKKAVQNSRRELTVEELQTICEATEGEMRLLFALGVYTGLRLGDCATLLWSDVDLARGRICRIPNKTARRNPKPVIVPLHPALQGMLAEGNRRDGEEHVLPETAALYEADAPALSHRIQGHFAACGVRTVKRGTGFKSVTDPDGKERRVHTGKRAVVEVGFHSLRHTFVSLCRESNAPLAVVEAIVGHANPAMTRHYTHVGDAAAGAAVAALPNVTGDMAVLALPEPATVNAEAVRKLADKLTAKNAAKVKKELLALVDATAQ